MKDILEKLIRQEDLTCEEASQVMGKIMRGEFKDAQVAAYLVALRCKGETVDEILGSCQAIREHSINISVIKTPLVDTCGTGGDGKGTFNISTVSAFVSAGAGITVAKHGNRAVSGQCGSADLCEALGINIELSAADLELCLNETGLGFLYAPLLHPAMAHALPARKALGLRTIFNILGPLNNPAGAKRQLMGVYEAGLTEKMAAVLASLSSEHALVVAGGDGLDEITLTAETMVTEVKNGKLHSYVIAPEDFGFSRVSLDSLRGGDAAEGARLCLAVMKGEKGSQRDVVLLNAGAALYVSGMAESIREGIELAITSIDSGAAYEKLQSLVQFSRCPAGIACCRRGKNLCLKR
ncbi:MAG: anthranilate phosphoribosyltransferase [Bacillota bacterium]|nr:anthranilate phosphoribosyltransferase [Bacillota bacterium]